MESLGREQETVVHLIDEDPTIRASAIERMRSPAYREHTLNYLAYYRSLQNYDLFSGILSRQQIREIEARTRTEYLKLLSELFGHTRIDGQLFFRLLMDPEKFFSKEIRNKIMISSGLDWPILFTELRDSLPQDLSYKTQLRIDPKRPGGHYDEVEDEIVFGAYSPNISTVLGFIHEFGHSIFLVPSDETNVLRVLAANESYAELWAEKLLRFSFVQEIFDPKTEIKAIEKYMRLRDLLSLRFHLFVLDMDREIHRKPFIDVKEYNSLSEKLSRRYLAARRFPPVLPVMPQMRIPGYLQSYLAIPFLKAIHRSKIQESRLVKSLIDLGPIILDSASQSSFHGTLRGAVQGCLDGTLRDCLD